MGGWDGRMGWSLVTQICSIQFPTRSIKIQSSLYNSEEEGKSSQKHNIEYIYKYFSSEQKKAINPQSPINKTGNQRG